jgi:hypothetical protein
MANRNQYDDDWDQNSYNRSYYRRNRGWDQGDFTNDWDQGDYGGNLNRSRYYDRNYDWNRFNRGSFNRRDYYPDWDQGYYAGNWNQGYNRSFNRYNRGNFGSQSRFNRDYGQGYYGNDFDTGYDYGYRYGNDWDYDTGPTWTYYEFWYVPGPFTGVGPSGYQRSDERICDDIHHRLTQHGQIDASNVHVDVDDGVVTLTGSVPDRRQKRLAEDSADDIPGVADVHNNLQVERSRQGRFGQSQSGMQRKQTDKGEIHLGMNVMGSDGKQAGTVKEIRNNDFLLDRSMDRDVYVPFRAIQSVQNDQIQMNVAADDVDNQNWPQPQVMGMGSNQGQQGR